MISSSEVADALPVTAAVEALAASFASRVDVVAPHRTQLPLADGTLLVMPAAGMLPHSAPWGDGSDVGAAAPGAVSGGVKVVTVRAANPGQGAPTVQALYLLFGGTTLAPLAVIDGPALTNLRTSAVSALVARLLALPDAHRLVIFGAGAQARAHLTALAAVRPVDEVMVVGRDPERARRLIEHAAGLGMSARVGDAADVAQADLVCACTTSRTPLFDGTLLRPGVHVTAVGAYQADTREIDDATVLRGRLVVEDRAAALAEAGDLAIPIAAGVIDADHIVADLAELCAGAQVRRSPQDITVFKSVGLAVEDLVIADAVYRAVTSTG